MKRHKKLIIVGAGAAGTGIGILLEKLNFHDYIILERDEIGASFRQWPKEMRFITPSFTGQGFGALDLNALTPGTSPAYTFRKEHLSGDEYADFLALLVDHFKINVQTETAVETVTKENGQFKLETPTDTWTSEAVVWATGEFQFANTGRIHGDEHGVHVGEITSYDELEKGKYVVIGGGESGMDAAYHLALAGNEVTVVLDSSAKDVEADPSKTLSPYTFERMQKAVLTGRVTFKEQRLAERIKEERSGYTVKLDNGEHIETSFPPILATGFHSGATQIKSLFEWQPNGKPYVTEEADESTITEGLYLTGPSVQHESAVFCFIYKFRARFAVVVNHLFNKWGMEMDEGVFEDYMTNQMVVEDVTCCEVSCEC
ncbi:NAD(P)/FAD-dependent oxidoreductase [Alteribacillus sp. HJP-4]|uniref:NAD(P)/FAD-dependent oxidoreductase n=1 Tax=Alteribacillus sp. HJP-4 TaxID=2775394 RepID=UPI0035CD3C0F